MLNSPKVSIIIPVYNVEPYLSVCLESCISQTLYDIEIITVDDGSTDQSGKILELYKKKDSRITVIHQENSGLSSARNTGMKVASGKWIVFLDSDDFLSVHACERIWREANEGPTEIIIFNTAIFPQYPEADPWYEYVLTVYAHRVHGFLPKDFFYGTGSFPFVWRQAYSRDLLLRTGVMFDETTRYGEDILFQFQIFPLTEEIAYIDDNLYNYRWIRPGSLMEHINDDYVKKVQTHLGMVRKISDYWNEKGLLQLYGEDYLLWVLNFLTPDLKKVREIVERKQLSNEIQGMLKHYKIDKKWIKLPVRRKLRYLKNIVELNL